jgi:hypothetical protein
MRKLGHGQTVMFCITEEIEGKIRSCSPRVGRQLTVSDVLRWAIFETHAEMKRSIPLWAMQGERFVRHKPLWDGVQADDKYTAAHAQALTFREKEARSLDDRYRPRVGDAQHTLARLSDTVDPGMQLVVERCQQFQDISFNASTLQEEQERELSPETEQERQIYKPAPAKPLRHELHPDIEHLARTGELSHSGPLWSSKTAFASLGETSLAKLPAAETLGGKMRLLASRDFATSVERTGHGSADEYQKSVQWVLSIRLEGSTTIRQAMVISPFEACALIPIVEKSDISALHLYNARDNSAHDSLDELTFFTITNGSATAAEPIRLAFPRYLAMQLNLFAGQLYFSTYNDYRLTCRLLGLACEKAAPGMHVAFDGFIERSAAGLVGGDSGLTESPVGFLRKLVTQVRRQGKGISKTHVGAMLEGRILEREEFE